ncbi:MAG: glycoside hydrolase family 2 protein [Halorhabdus sp.]
MFLHTESRDTQSLAGTWQAFPDPYRWFEDNWFDDSGVPFERDPAPPSDYDVDDGYAVEVPGCMGEQIEALRYYEGLTWYVRRFDHAADADRAFLRFGAVNYAADVWLNGTHVGHHEGGYTPFSFEVTGAIEPTDNLLVVSADNTRHDTAIPETQTDWFNFGGIFRPVDVVCVPETFVRHVKVETNIEPDKVIANVDAWIDGDDPEGVAVELPELDAKATVDRAATRDGLVRFSGTVELDRDAVTLWDAEQPRLYDIAVTCETDRLDERIGFREVAVEGGDVLLNGEPVELRGVSMHEESAGRGRALTASDIERRFEWLGQLGCNFARLAHYPHTERIARRADEEGILLWEEVPAYWQITFEQDDVQELYRQQLRELIQRDWNRPSVLLWSIANETDHEDDVRNRVLPDMVAYVRELDETRLVTAACWLDETETGFELRDPLADTLDVVGINEYRGWYEGKADDLNRFAGDPDGPPIVISETGAGAEWGNHGPADERWTEEFQAAYYRDTLRAIDGNEQIVGLSPWILFDFMSPRRLNPHQRGYNRKGLLDERGRKKRAFDVLAEHYRGRQ